ncbi:MAG: hypothetical protein KDA65_03200 [Planctomycetaceae bacterium]|nr:hypothetical protein [Planctomycetaceae bacterium]
MKKSLLTIAAVILTVSALTGSAQAGGFGISLGKGGISVGGKGFGISIGGSSRSQGHHHHHQSYQYHSTPKYYSSTPKYYSSTPKYTTSSTPVYTTSQTPKPVTVKPTTVVAKKVTTLPEELQGTWYELSPQNTIYAYVLRASDYDMYEVNPKTEEVVEGENGQPNMLKKEPLTYENSQLILSPGENQEGPYQFKAGPEEFEAAKLLTSADGKDVRLISKNVKEVLALAEPQTTEPTTKPTTEPATKPATNSVNGAALKMVTYKSKGATLMIFLDTPGNWIESTPEGRVTYTELGRDAETVFLKANQSSTILEINLKQNVIVVNGQDTHNIVKAL